MLQNGVTELIWHFAGYLHLTDELARARSQYEDLRAMRNELELQFDETGHETDPGELEQLSSGRTDVHWPSFDQISQIVDPAWYRFLTTDPQRFTFDLGSDPYFKPFFPFSIPFSFNYVEGPNVTRQEWGHETNVDLDQLNMLNDNDSFGVREGLSLYAVSGINVHYEMATMREIAEEAIPEHLFPKGGGNIHVVGSNLAEAQLAKLNSGEEPSTLEMGLYVNGVLQDEEETEETETETSDADDRREGAPPPIPEQPDGWAPGDPGLVGAETGSNTVYNAAVIVDADEGVGTFVVFGDYFRTNTIAQVNVYSDSDHIQIGNPGAGFSLSLSLDGNVTTNSANFSRESLLDEAIDFRGFTGFFWNIDISYGDYYDVKSLYQENVLYSNDILYQTSTASHQRVMVDANGQTNAAIVEDWGNSYDLIVVLGSYFSGNFIHQTNVLLDNDWVVMASPGVGGSQTLYGGQNELSNEAAITSYGLDSFGSISAGFEAFLRSLETSNRIDPEDWWSFSGSGSGKMNVLFVTGDYYDINFIKQLNVIADSDAVMQVGGDGSHQFLSTGGNTLTNFATIIDVDAYGDQYVGGEVYEEWTLVQTNVIGSEDDEVVYGDAEQLANEVVAFAYAPEEESEQTETGVAPASSSSGDELGQLMA
ncbi:hypothetical protein [Roseibium sp. SCP14]|uniref:hypothetical protein n=1 Tax=Roseibium sp. SCP14 TaxID=3141375 RepID=UPI00333DEFB1